MINTLRLTILVSVAAIVLNSCYSTIGVRVDSLDMDKMKQTPEYLRVAKEKELNNYVRMIESDYFGKLELSIGVQTAKAIQKDTNVAKEDFNATIRVITPKIHNAVENAKQKTIGVRDALQANLRLGTSETKTSYSQAYIAYVAGRSNLAGFARALILELDGETVIELVAAIETAIAQTDGVYGISILDDGMASFVAKAPEEYWQRYKTNFYEDSTDLEKRCLKARINQTKVTTLIGNSDIAIKMNGPGNFVIKGARVDGDEAVRASFKVFAQGVKYIAAAYGVPVAPASGSSETPTAQIPEIADLEKNRTSSEQLKNQYQTNTNAFLQIIAAEKDNLLSNNQTKRIQAIKSIKAAYTFYKSQLKTQ